MSLNNIDDKYNIDSHKLMYHAEHLSLWSQGKDIYPIYIEIALSGTCNHRCIFCALDYLNYQPNILNTKILKKFISDAAKGGIKSVMFAGEGEPLLHKDIAGLIRFTKERNIDVAVTTNGVLLNKHPLKDILKDLSWLRVSLNASTPKSYSSIHRTSPRDFDTVLNNLRAAVKIRQDEKYNCTIGAQFLLLAQNYKEAESLARLLAKIGIDYLIVKPYSQHPLSKNRLKDTVNYQSLLRLENKLKRFSTNKFKIIFRRHTMDKLIENKPYKRCLGLPFWSYLDARGNLYACSSFLGNKKFCYGNINEQDFEAIWEGKNRQRIKKMMRDWDTLNCRDVCRLDEINRYLWQLKIPPKHVNFI